MEAPLPAATPATLDSWLREHLGRRMVIVGLSLPVAGSPQSDVVLGPPPTAFLRELEPFEEVWPRWLTAGTRMDQALTRAAMQEGDAVLLWLAELATDPRPAPLVAFLEQAETAGALEEAVTALVGPGASRTLAHRLGFNEGFAPSEAPGWVACQLAREVVALEELRRRGSSPPCYL